MRILAAVAAVAMLSGCATHGTPVVPTDPVMVTKVNNALAMPLDQRQIQDLADKTCRDFSYIFNRDAIVNYVYGFAATQTQNSSTKAQVAIGTMLGANCPATGKRIMRVIDS